MLTKKQCVALGGSQMQMQNVEQEASTKAKGKDDTVGIHLFQ
jgi:hypothetical protein